MKNYQPINVEINETALEDQPELREIKPLENLVADTDTYAKLIDSNFHNGTIRLRMYRFHQHQG